MWKTVVFVIWDHPKRISSPKCVSSMALHWENMCKSKNLKILKKLSIAVTYGTFSVTYGTVLSKCPSLTPTYQPETMIPKQNFMGLMWSWTSISGLISFPYILRVHCVTVKQNIGGHRFVSRTWQSLQTDPCGVRLQKFHRYCAFINADKICFPQISIGFSRNWDILKFLGLKSQKLILFV